MDRKTTSLLLITLLALAGVAGCKSSGSDAKPPVTSTTPSSAQSASPTPQCRQDFGDDVQTSGRTAGAAAKTGITAAADGIVQAGSATAGLVHGGSDEAKKKWKDGGEETTSDARKNAAETRHEANTPACK